MLFKAILMGVGPLTHRWPSGREEHYDLSLMYNVLFENRRYNVVLAFTRERYPIGYHVVVFVDGYPRIEFAPTKDYDRTGHLITLIRRNRRMLDLEEVPPEIKSRYSIVIHRDMLPTGGGYNKAAILVRSSDIDKMIELALLRIKGII